MLTPGSQTCCDGWGSRNKKLAIRPELSGDAVTATPLSAQVEEDN